MGEDQRSARGERDDRRRIQDGVKVHPCPLPGIEGFPPAGGRHASLVRMESGVLAPDEVLQKPGATRMLQPSQRLGFDLTNALAGQLEERSDLAQGMDLPRLEPVAQLEDLAL